VKVADANALRELLAVADVRLDLETDGHPTLALALDPGCWWFRNDHALVYLPFGPRERDELAVGVVYLPLPRNTAPEAQLELAPGLVVVRDKALAEPRESSTTVRGTVRDSDGRPVRATVAAVANGSKSVTTDQDGGFALADVPFDEFVLHASTEDGRVAIRTGIRCGMAVDLVVAPGASMTLRLAGRDTIRCALFQGEVRFEDFTLRSGHDARVVVPPGEIRLELYDHASTALERTVRMETGGHEEIAFSLGS
jgi:hypothetical protein